MVKKSNTVENESNETLEETLESELEELKEESCEKRFLIHVEVGQTLWSPGSDGRPISKVVDGGIHSVHHDVLKSYEKHGIKFRHIE